MGQKIVIRHRSGSKANQVEEFPDIGRQGIVGGRDAQKADVTFDELRDDMVSREHFRILQEPDSGGFYLQDLSRNGCFVQQQRVHGAAPLHHGDLVQLGAGGPEFRFELDPPPVSAGPKPTVEAPLPGRALLATREAPAPTPEAAAPFPAMPPGLTAEGQSRAPGKRTVQRMIEEYARRETGRHWIAIGVLAGILFLVVVAALFWSRRQPPSLERIAAANTPAVVFVEVTWTLEDMEKGRHIYQYAISGARLNKRGVPLRDIFHTDRIPVYCEINGHLAPFLVNTDNNGANFLIGGRHSGTGFLVSEDGLIITNRHVAATWKSRYTQFQPGILIHISPSGFEMVEPEQPKDIVSPSEIPELRDWTPDAPGNQFFRVEGPKLVLNAQRAVTGALAGSNLRMEVTLPGTAQPMAATLQRVSGQHDLALIKIEPVQKIAPVRLAAADGKVATGARVLVMGYPDVSAKVFSANQSQDIFSPHTRITQIPVVSADAGIVAVLPLFRSGPQQTIASDLGDLMQLNVNASGAGNSGGPVFDENGEVIAVFNSGFQAGGGKRSGAVPIRFVHELLANGSVIR